MKTQGLTLMQSKMSEIKVTKKTTGETTKANDQTFDSFIKNSAGGAKVENKSKAPEGAQIQQSKKSEDGTSSDTTQSKDAKSNEINTNNSRTNDTKATTDKTDNAQETTDVAKVSNETVDQSIDTEEVNEKVLEILSGILGLNDQELTDLFNMVDMEPKDLFLGIQSGEIESFSITTVQTFVMEVHGIEDPSAFLTNDVLNKELNDIFDQMKQLMADLMGITLDDKGEIKDDVWKDFVTQLIGTKEIAPTENVEKTQLIDIPTDVTESDNADEQGQMQVIIENRTSSDAGSQMGASTGQGSGLGADELDRTAQDVERLASQTTTNPLSEFADKLADAVSDQAPTTETRQTMTEMVEQVVKQVRVRVMPETTNMEIQLHPASLGKVSVQINATATQASARLIVETQAAKEALESGMIRLQEAFEEKGIKVESVEVTVSNFDLMMKQDDNDQSQTDEGSGRRNGSSSNSSGETQTEPVDNQTEASRRDINSTVDYTA